MATDEARWMRQRVVLTVSGVIAADIREQIASGKRPRTDYLELARSFNADLLDYAVARTMAGRTGAVLRLRLLECRLGSPPRSGAPTGSARAGLNWRRKRRLRPKPSSRPPLSE